VPDSELHVLLVTFAPFPTPSGLATRLAQRIAALSNGGYLLDVLTPRTASLPHVSRLADARVFRVPMPRSREQTARASPRNVNADRLAAFERAVRRQIEAEEYDAIHLMDACAAAVVLDSKDSAVCLYEPADHFHSGDSQFESELERRHMALLAAAHAVIYPTPHLAGLANRTTTAPDRAQVLPPAVDLDLFTPRPAPPDTKGQLRVALVASAVTEDDLALLSSALRLLPSDCGLRITLSAPLTSDMRKVLRGDPELRDHVDARDPKLYDDLVPLYQDAHAGLVLAGVAGDGKAHPKLQAMAEMMATGLAPIIPDVAELHDLVPGDAAVWVAPGDPATLAQGLERLARDRKLLQSIRTKAYQTAVRTFDERAAASKLLRLYESLLQQRPELSTLPDSAGFEHPDASAVLRRAWSNAGGARQGSTTAPVRSNVEPVTVAQRTPVRAPVAPPQSAEETTSPDPISFRQSEKLRSSGSRE
jgi:glycosyltransferase involved in cell wall biosynthesis